MKFLPYVCLCLLLATGACKKDNTESGEPLEKVSNVPALTYVGVNSSIVQVYDDVELTVQYLDGDGDLGSADADEHSIYVYDSRDTSLAHTYHLQPLAPAGSTIAIQGNLVIRVENVILLDENSTSETATFKVKLKDQSGNWSNEVTSDVITIEAN